MNKKFLMGRIDGEEGKGGAGLRFESQLWLFVLGLMSKPKLVTLLFVLILLDYWPLGRIEFKPVRQEQGAGLEKTIARPVLEKAPLYLITAIFCVVVVSAQGSLKSVPHTAPPATWLCISWPCCFWNLDVTTKLSNSLKAQSRQTLPSTKLTTVWARPFGRWETKTWPLAILKRLCKSTRHIQMPEKTCKPFLRNPEKIAKKLEIPFPKQYGWL